MRISGSLTQLHLLSYASRFVLPLTRKAASGWLAGLYRRAVEPLDHYERFSHMVSPFHVLLTLLTFIREPGGFAPYMPECLGRLGPNP